MDGLNGLLWVLAIILAIVFVVIGLVLVRDDPGGKRRLGWAEGTPSGVARFVGVVMILGGLCLVIPPLIPGLGALTPVSAFILAMLMLGIAQSYLAKRDGEGAAVYILLLVLLGVLAFGRWSLLGGLAS